MSILGTTDLGNRRLAVTVDHDPKVTATACDAGSYIVNSSTKKRYWKLDDGETTNVREIDADEAKEDTQASYAARLQNFQFGRDTQVPGSGTLALYGPGDTTVGVRINRAGTITGAAIEVDTADASREYDLSVHKNGVSVATVHINNVTGNSDNTLSVAVAVGDLLTAYMVRTAGVGASSFGNEHAVIEVMF